MELFFTFSKFFNWNKTDRTDRPKRLKQKETLSLTDQKTENRVQLNQEKLTGGKQATDARKSGDKLDTRNIRKLTTSNMRQTSKKERQ